MKRHATENPSAARTAKHPGATQSHPTDESAAAGPSSTSFDREQAIREAAYACFEARGCEPGHELDDWLKAEAMVEQANGGAGPTQH
jgi:hypothetical protein